MIKGFDIVRKNLTSEQVARITETLDTYGYRVLCGEYHFSQNQDTHTGVCSPGR